MMVAGIVGTSLGGVLAGFGAALFLAEEGTCSCDESFGPGEGGCDCGRGDEGVETAAAAMIAGGIALAGVGIPLLIVGARRTKPETPVAPGAPPAPAKPPAAAELLVGPGSGALRVRF